MVSAKPNKLKSNLENQKKQNSVETEEWLGEIYIRQRESRKAVEAEINQAAIGSYKNP